MRRRRPWIGLAALLALGGCSMGLPSPSDDGLGGGSAAVTAPEPVGVPPGTPDAPPSPDSTKPVDLTPPASSPAPAPKPTTPAQPAPAAPTQASSGSRGLRLPLGSLDDPGSAPLANRRRVAERAPALRLGLGGPGRAVSEGAPGIGLDAVASPLPVPGSSPALRVPGGRAEGLSSDGLPGPGVTGAPAGASQDAVARLSVPDSAVVAGKSAAPFGLGFGSASPLSAVGGVSPGIDPARIAPGSGLPSRSPALAAGGSGTAGAGGSGPLGLGSLPGVAQPDTTLSARPQLDVAAAIPAPSPVAGVSPALGSLPGAPPPASPAAGTLGIAAPVAAPARVDSPQSGSARSSLAPVVSLAPGSAGAAANAPSQGPLAANLPAAPSSRSASPSAPLASGFIAGASEPDGDAASRKQAQQRAREDERRSHSSGMRRWFQDHFPFLF